MDTKSNLSVPAGVLIRNLVAGSRIQIAFSWKGKQCRELLTPCNINKQAILYADNLRQEIKRKIADGSFEYATYFPDSPKAKLSAKAVCLMEDMLNNQLRLYDKQVANGQMSPSTYRGYKKSLTGERMRHWHGWKLAEVTPSALRDWVSGMDCTSKAIRNMLIPLRSVFEDALNDGLITINPFDRVALTKLIRQTSKASDYVIEPFSRSERDSILEACRSDEWPMYQFWFNTGLRPGELQALEWRHIDLDKASARIEQNQVVGVIKMPKTAAGIRTLDLNPQAIDALKVQKGISALRGERVFLNLATMKPWATDAQIRKNSWLPLMARSGIKYRNPYQIRHTFASTLLTAGGNPWYVASQLGHEDVEMVFRTYGKFITEDYQKPRAVLTTVK